MIARDETVPGDVYAWAAGDVVTLPFDAHRPVRLYRVVQDDGAGSVQLQCVAESLCGCEWCFRAGGAFWCNARSPVAVQLQSVQLGLF